MGVRTTKGRALTRYLTGTTGIPMLSWDGYTIQAPPPYSFSVTTAKDLDDWHEKIRDSFSDEMAMCIRYDLGMGEVDQAWVAMRLGSFAPMLKSHYETIGDRIETYRRGD